MDNLWAPWRQTYFNKKQRGCFLCRAVKSRKDHEHLVVTRRKRAFSILNLYPYNNGHMLVVPRKHVSDVDQLTRLERNELMDLVLDTKQLCKKVLKAQGFNIGMNLGKAAGAGLETHVHVHIVPRWLGDTNFMPVIAGTKVISDSLDAFWEKMRFEDAKCKKR